MAQQNNASGNMIQMIILFIVLFGAMYFFSVRPQRKRMAAQQEKLSRVKKGDAVIIRSGLHGKIDSVNQEKKTFVLDANGILLTFELGAILQVVNEKKANDEHLNTKDDTDTAQSAATEASSEEKNTTPSSAKEPVTNVDQKDEDK